MALKRIKDITTTATLPSSDDYIELDGATSGSRKLPASVLSNLRNGLAPRQGLVFDGTSGVSVINIPAFGTGDFAVAAVVNSPIAINYQPVFGGTTNGFALWVRNNGALVAEKVGVASILTSTSNISASKPTHVAYVRSSGTGTFYINGVASGSGADATDYSTAIANIAASSALAIFRGTISAPVVFNRALSAAEVNALYESAAPTAADYNSASNTAINTGTVTSQAPYAVTLSGESATGFNAVKASGDGMVQVAPAPTVRPGEKLLVAFDIVVNSGDAPSVELEESGYNTASNSLNATTGSHSVILTATSLASRLVFWTVGATDYTISNLSVKRLGVLFAPEANAPGNGYQWKDASANKADIKLPTLGVKWALPDFRPNSVRGTLTWSATHEGKSLLGQRALPDGAVPTLLTRKATAGSSGTGCTIGTTNSATRWQAADTFTTAKEVATLANQLPAGTADADNDIVVDPDSANFTGSIEVEMHYQLTQAGV